VLIYGTRLISALDIRHDGLLFNFGLIFNLRHCVKVKSQLNGYTRKQAGSLATRDLGELVTSSDVRILTFAYFHQRVSCTLFSSTLLITYSVPAYHITHVASSSLA
jgi:hypothetical protein